jgi:putative tryptophan/tyrosine transport system substrate-binding protein
VNLLAVRSRGSRRQFVRGEAGLGLLAGCGRLPWQAPSTTRVWRLGVLGPWSGLGDLRDGLRELGYVEGQNLAVEYRDSEDQRERLPGLAAELVRLQPDVIVAPTSVSVEVALQATNTLPIVFGAVSDPVGQGFVTSLARPGRNVTGLSDFGVTLSAKRLELLKESIAGGSTVAVLRNVTNPATALEWQATVDAARTLGVELQALEVRGADDLPGAFETARKAHADALLILTDSIVNFNLQQITGLAASGRLPAMYFQKLQAAGGGLMAYGPNYVAMWRRTAVYVDRILKGANPADLPIEQPTTFDFVINLKTAQALGLTIPPHVLLQATEVIQ